MAPSKLFVFALSVALIFVIGTFKADVSSDGSNSSSLKVQLDQLNTKIQFLDSQISEKSQELKKKDGIIAEQEKLFNDRSSVIQSLHNTVASLQACLSLTSMCLMKSRNDIVVVVAAFSWFKDSQRLRTGRS
ncbi:unnamed protein product [Vicia faba]|uniref:Uncharacterized protein n=1 Tax=Vicia faba TaxID=3906 RepID=A0AAV1AYC6_VICFA|nr:unnamed protein product [Vicia faba]